MLAKTKTVNTLAQKQWEVVRYQAIGRASGQDTKMTGIMLTQLPPTMLRGVAHIGLCCWILTRVAAARRQRRPRRRGGCVRDWPVLLEKHTD